MAQGRFERVRFNFAREVIAARTEISSAEYRTPRNFPFQVEIVLERVRELRMVRRRKDIDRLLQGRTLRVEEAGEYKSIYAEKRRQKSIDAKQKNWELIAKNAGSTPEYGLTVTENVPDDTGLRRKKIRR